MDRRILGRWLVVSVTLAMIIFIVGVDSDELELGNAIDILDGYGRLAEIVRVMRRSDRNDSRVFRGPRIKVLDAPSEFNFPFSFVEESTVMDFNVQIEFCSNFRKLVQEYFRAFMVAGVDESSRVFFSDWSKPAIAKLFGINESFVEDNYSYVLLKIARMRDSKRMLRSTRQFHIFDAVAREARNVEINETASADRFISQFGTHYVSSFATGDFIYQVYVDTPSYLRYLKQHISRTGLERMDPYERDLMFSPWHSLHVGKILSASGSPLVEAWAEENLEGLYAKDERYWTILQIFSDRELTHQLGHLLKDNALLQMKLKMLTPVFENPEIREWFEQYVCQRLHQLSVRNVRRK